MSADISVYTLNTEHYSAVPKMVICAGVALLASGACSAQSGVPNMPMRRAYCRSRVVVHPFNHQLPETGLTIAGRTIRWVQTALPTSNNIVLYIVGHKRTFAPLHVSQNTATCFAGARLRYGR
jgi:hypothetical protein